MAHRDSFVGLVGDCMLSTKVQALMNDCFGKMSPTISSGEEA